VVDCTGLEIRRTVMQYRGFESHPLRQFQSPATRGFFVTERREPTAWFAVGFERCRRCRRPPHRGVRTGIQKMKSFILCRSNRIVSARSARDLAESLCAKQKNGPCAPWHYLKKKRCHFEPGFIGWEICFIRGERKSRFLSSFEMTIGGSR
jgi:hypothetical protein